MAIRKKPPQKGTQVKILAECGNRSGKMVRVNQAVTVGSNIASAVPVVGQQIRFMMLGGLMYLASSLEGSLESLRSVNRITHFTHFTVAHAHLGMYSFVSIVLFGAFYFMLPRVLNWEWPYPRLITLHFWLVAVGMAIYVVGLSIGGWLQGEAMLDAAP